MIVDDNDIDQMICKRVAGKCSFVDSVVSYLYAEEALEHLETQRPPVPDVILLDINMPRMDGFEFLEALADSSVDIQSTVVVMLTTSSDTKDRNRASQFKHVKGYLTKPLSKESLEDMLESIDS